MKLLKTNPFCIAPIIKLKLHGYFCNCLALVSMNLKLFLLIISLSLFALPSEAHHGGEGGLGGGAGIAGPIVTIPAYALPKGSKFVSFITNYLDSNNYSNRGLKLLGKRGENYDVVENALTPSLTFGLGITNKLSLSAQIPYPLKFGIRTIQGTPDINSEGNALGVGDINFFSLYEFIHSDKHDLHAALLTGLKIPSGVRRDLNRQGKLFNAEHQPGTGSWDPQIGLSVSKHWGIFHFDTNGMYRFSTKGTQNTILGDVVSYNFAVSYLVGTRNSFIDRVFPKQLGKTKLKWHLISEMNGAWVEKPKLEKHREENEGGNLVYLSPGLRMIVNEKWITNLSVGLPTIHDLNGRRKPPNIRLILGITRVF